MQMYRQMLTVMKSRGGAYSGADIPEFYALVQELFTPEEAEINNALDRKPAQAADIAAKLNWDEAQVRQILEQMADKGLCVSFTSGNIRLYMGSSFMPGIFEYQMIAGKSGPREIRIARLIHEYKDACHKAKLVPKPAYPLTRVIPVEKTIHAGNVLRTYDQVSTYIDKYDAIAVGICYCRHAAKLRGGDTHDMPMDVCMWFGHIAQYMAERLGGKMVSRAQAREVLDKSEKAGLLHMSRNTADDIEFICNCDRWHCEVVTQALKNPCPGLFFNSGFEPIFDAAKCIACETCLHRCPPEALTMGADTPGVNPDLCFGCGLCASGCEQNAISMKTKQGFAPPPKDVKALVAALKSAG